MSSGRRGMHILNSMGSTPKEQVSKVWTKEEILKMWPQAAGELKGLERVLQANTGITAAQLAMALQLADAEFQRLKSE